MFSKLVNMRKYFVEYTSVHTAAQSHMAAHSHPLTPGCLLAPSCPLVPGCPLAPAPASLPASSPTSPPASCPCHPHPCHHSCPHSPITMDRPCHTSHCTHLHIRTPRAHTHTPISLVRLLHLLSLTTCCSSFTALPILCPEGSAFPADGSATTNGSYADQRDDGGDSDRQEDHDHDHEDSRASLHLRGVTMEEFIDPTLEAGSTMCVGSVRKHRCRDRSRIMAKMKTHIWRSMTLTLSPTLSRSMTELSL